MKKIFILVCSCMILAACGNSAKKNNNTAADTVTVAKTDTIDTHNAENSLDYIGTYKGTFPAADCPGIETSLTLNNNNTFTQHYSYIDRNTSFDEKGTYTVEGNILTLKEDKGETSYYKVEENKIRKLDADKQVITGELADYYILNKE